MANIAMAETMFDISYHYSRFYEFIIDVMRRTPNRFVFNCQVIATRTVIFCYSSRAFVEFPISDKSF
jgi:hypothetical protein